MHSRPISKLIKMLFFPMHIHSFRAAPALYEAILYVSCKVRIADTICETISYFRDKAVGTIITSDERNDVQMV